MLHGIARHAFFLNTVTTESETLKLQSIHNRQYRLLTALISHYLPRTRYLHVWEYSTVPTGISRTQCTVLSGQSVVSQSVSEASVAAAAAMAARPPPTNVNHDVSDRCVL